MAGTCGGVDRAPVSARNWRTRSAHSSARVSCRVGIHDLSAQRGERHGGQRRERVVGREQHGQRLQPDQPRVEVVDWALIDPCSAPEDDVDLAEPQAIERAADAAAVAAAELDVREHRPAPDRGSAAPSAALR